MLDLAVGLPLAHPAALGAGRRCCRHNKNPSVAKGQPPQLSAAMPGGACDMSGRPAFKFHPPRALIDWDAVHALDLATTVSRPAFVSP